MHPVADCALCPLVTQGRTAPVAGSGPTSARVMVVGEAPGANEDRSGVPFVGAAGKLLERLLAASGLTRREVYVTNVVKCRPPENRDPLPVEVDACTTHYLHAEVTRVKPQVVVAVGRFAAAYFIPDREFSKSHGVPHKRGPMVVLPVYHPAAALHNGKVLSIVERDFSAIPAALALASRDEKPIVVVDGVAPGGGVVAIDTEANIRDGRLVAVSTSRDGVTTYVQKAV